MLCFVFFLSSFTSETTERERYDQSERERSFEREREREFCVWIFFDRKGIHWRREKLAALSWSKNRTGKRGKIREKI